MKDVFSELFAPYLNGSKKLCLGAGANPETGDGWVNVDMKPQSPKVLQHDLRVTPWPFETGEFGTVLASHVMEHFAGEELVGIVREVSRVLKVGGHFIIIVPYGTHQAAWNNPLHLSRWDEQTPVYFSRSTYEVEGTAGTGAGQGLEYAEWTIEVMTFTPTPEWADRSPVDIYAAQHRELNVVSEMQVVMELKER